MAPANPSAGVNPAAAVNSAVFSNLFGGQPALSDAQDLLLTLQANVQQALPILRSLTSGLYPATTGGLPPPEATDIRRAAPNTAQTAPGRRLPATGQDARAVTQGIIVAPGQVLGMLGVNVYAMDQATWQRMAALHNELAQIMPLLQQLNGTADAVAALRVAEGTGNLDASLGFTNRFAPVTNRMLLNRSAIAPRR
jgi:hypothetical protein